MRSRRFILGWALALAVVTWVWLALVRVRVSHDVAGPNGREVTALIDTNRLDSTGVVPKDIPTPRASPALRKQETPTSADSAIPASRPVAVQERVKRFMDAGLPIQTRQAELAELAKKDDAESAAVLMALGQEHTYLNATAVEALGNMKVAGVVEYLKVKLADGDPRVLSAAVRSLARLEGEEAIPVIATFLKNNHQRPDGFQDMVCAASVLALGEIRSARAVPALDAELRETVGTTLSHEYGSQIVRALAAIHSLEARTALLAYADRLDQSLRKSDDNPMGKHYIEAKIKEAREAAESLMN